jgi:threonine/homoserine/homoserine lactone efflux protein
MLFVTGTLLALTVVPGMSAATSVSDSMSQQSKQGTKIFSGTIIKNGDNFVLSDAANKLSHVLDNTQRPANSKGRELK